MQARTVRELLALSTDYLKKQGCSSPRLDAEVLLGHVLKMDRLTLYLNLERPLITDEVDEYRKVIGLRGRRIPVPYITGEREFFSRKFAVAEGVLIPRPETELLVDKVTHLLGSVPHPKILDLGTGSGIIAVTLALSLPEADLVAVDVSEVALQVASQNASLLGVSKERIRFIHSDLFNKVPKEQFHVICSNPPYIPSDEISGLEKELHYEPRTALDGGKDGLDLYRRILRQAPPFIVHQGYLVLEIGWNQGDAIKELAKENGWQFVETIVDYAGLNRVVILRWP